MTSATTIRERAALALGVPLLRFLGASLVDDANPGAGVSVPTGIDLLNAAQGLHAGAISTLLEVAAYLAILPELADDEEATTHAMFVTYIARAEADAPLAAKGRLVRRGRRVAFSAAELHQADRLLASAQITKSIYVNVDRR